jgi:hypothetical protein
LDFSAPEYILLRCRKFLLFWWSTTTTEHYLGVIFSGLKAAYCQCALPKNLDFLNLHNNTFFLVPA